MEPMGTREIAAYCGVEPLTVHQWRQRGRFPAPEGHVSGTPWWWRSTVEAWAVEHGYPKARDGSV